MYVVQYNINIFKSQLIYVTGTYVNNYSSNKSRITTRGTPYQVHAGTWYYGNRYPQARHHFIGYIAMSGNTFDVALVLKYL